MEQTDSEFLFEESKFANVFVHDVHVNPHIFSGVVSGAAVCFTVGVFKLSSHQKQRLRIHRMVQKIKRHPCVLE